MTDLSLLSWVQLARASPAAPWLWLCQAMSSWVGRGNSSGGVYPTSPGCRKAQLYLLFLSRVRKYVGNHVQKSPQIHSLIPAQFWENVLQLPATGKLRVKLPSHSWAGVSLGSCFQEWTRVCFLLFNTKSQMAQSFSSISTLLLRGNNKIPVRSNQLIP